MKKFFWQIAEMSWWGWLAGAALLLSFAVLSHGQTRRHLQAAFPQPQREVLSIVSADLFAQGKVNRVVKVRTPENMLIEVYGPLEDHGRKLLDTIQINDRRDAHYYYLGQVTNLVLKDIDGDRLPEIVAPTYDAQMMPHLNIFKFNKENQRFEPHHGSLD